MRYYPAYRRVSDSTFAAELATCQIFENNRKMSLEVSRLKNVKMLVLDVDGVLTDCRIFLDANGEWKRFFSIRDGVGLKFLKDAGYKLAVITGTKAVDIQARVKVLGIHYFYEGAMDKGPSFENLVKDSGLKPQEMAYVGDDVFDIPLMEKVCFALG